MAYVFRILFMTHLVSLLLEDLKINGNTYVVHDTPPSAIRHMMYRSMVTSDNNGQ